MKDAVVRPTELHSAGTLMWSTWAHIRINAGAQQPTRMLEYDITACAELLVTWRETFAGCGAARQIIASSCIQQIARDKPEPIYEHFLPEL